MSTTSTAKIYSQSRLSVAIDTPEFLEHAKYTSFATSWTWSWHMAADTKQKKAHKSSNS